MQAKVLAILMVLGCSVLAAVGQIFLKMGSAGVSGNLLSWLTNTKLILGIALYAISTIIFGRALKLGEVSVLYPIIAASYIWVAILASLFLGEQFSIMRWAGIGLIVLGIVFIIR